MSRWRILKLLPPLALALPQPAATAAGPVLHVALCGGGTMTIPLGQAPGTPGRREPPCAAACHALPCERRQNGKPKR